MGKDNAHKSDFYSFSSVLSTPFAFRPSISYCTLYFGCVCYKAREDMKLFTPLLLSILNPYATLIAISSTYTKFQNSKSCSQIVFGGFIPFNKHQKQTESSETGAVHFLRSEPIFALLLVFKH